MSWCSKETAAFDRQCLVALRAGDHKQIFGIVCSGSIGYSSCVTCLIGRSKKEHPILLEPICLQVAHFVLDPPL